MKRGQELINEVFGNDFSNRDLWQIAYDDFVGAENVENNIIENDEWYNFHEVKFNYQGKRYRFEYNKHVMGGDSEINFDSFVCLGNVEELSQTVSCEEFAEMQIALNNQILAMRRELEKEQQKTMLFKNPYAKLRNVNSSLIKNIIDSFAKMSTREDVSDSQKIEWKNTSEFFQEVLNLKQNRSI